MKISKTLFVIILFLFGCMTEQPKEETYSKDTLEIEEFIMQAYEEKEDLDTSYIETNIIILNDSHVVVSQPQISQENITRQKNQISKLDTTSFLKKLSKNLDIIEQQQKELDSLLQR